MIPICVGGLPGGGRWLDWESGVGSTADLIRYVVSPPDDVLVPSWQDVAFGSTNSSLLQDALDSRAGSVVSIPLLDGLCRIDPQGVELGDCSLPGGVGSNQWAHIGRTAGFVIEHAYVAGDNSAACGATIRCIIGTFVDRSAQDVSLVPLDDVTYGDPPQVLEASASTGLPVTLSATGPCTIADATVVIEGAGDCLVTASQAGNEDYLPASTKESFTIAPARLIVSPVDTIRTLGATSPAFAVRYTGFVNNESPSVLGGALLVAPTATVRTTAPDVYVIRASGLTHRTTASRTSMEHSVPFTASAFCTIRPNPRRERPLH